MSASGIVFALVVVALCSIEVVCHRWTKKITNYYWFWLGVSIFVLTYLIAMQWGWLWAYYAKWHPDPSGPDGMLTQWQLAKASLTSYVFMFNICYFVVFMMPVLLILDPTRKAARSLAPFAALASMMVLLIITPIGGEWSEFSWRYIFLGRAVERSVKPWHSYIVNDMCYMQHLMSLMLAIGIWLNTPKFKIKGLISVACAYTIMMLYIAIGTNITHCCIQTGGVRYNDFGGQGNFKTVGGMFHGDLPAARAFFWFFYTFVIVLVTCFLEFVCKRGWYKYSNKFSGKWYRWYAYDDFSKELKGKKVYNINKKR